MFSRREVDVEGEAAAARGGVGWLGCVTHADAVAAGEQALAAAFVATCKV